MSQASITASLDNDTSGPGLVTLLESLEAAMLTMHSGTSRPSYAVAGTLWRDTTATPWVLKMFDGTDDISLGTINASTDVFTVSESKNWVAYTPTFTGFGTVSAVSIWSRRVGDTLHVRGKFTCGTSTTVEARMTLGFNGTNSNVTSDATKVASLQLAGPMVRSTANASSYWTLIESSIGYITFGMQSTGFGGLTKRNGDDIAGTGVVLSLMAEVPISGW